MLSVPSLIDASKSTSATISSVGSVPDSKGAEDAFATALKRHLSVDSVASTSTNSTPVVNQSAALLAPPNKLEDISSPSSSGEGDTNTPKPFAGSIAEDLSSTTYISLEVRRIEKGRVVLDKENVHLNEPSTLRSRKRSAMARRFSPVTSPFHPVGGSSTTTSPIRPIDTGSSPRRK